MKDNKNLIIVEKNPIKPLKLALCVFIIIFAPEVINSIVVSIFIMIIGAGGILIYLIAPEKSKIYMNSVAGFRLNRK